MTPWLAHPQQRYDDVLTIVLLEFLVVPASRPPGTDVNTLLDSIEIVQGQFSKRLFLPADGGTHSAIHVPGLNFGFRPQSPRLDRHSLPDFQEKDGKLNQSR